MSTRIARLLAFSLMLRAQQGPPDLDRFRRTLREHLEQLRNYTCEVTIERLRKNSSKAPFVETDRVRVEVGFIGQRELFGWPGGDSIQESDVSRLVGGTISNGDFALNARSLLTLPPALFKPVPGNPLEFEFVVAADASDWILQSAEGQIQTAYRGTVWFEQDSGRLIRLQITASGRQLEPFGFERVTKTLAYRLIRDTNGSSHLLPEAAQLYIVERSGLEAKNQTQFNECRLFTAQSNFLAGPVAPSLPGQSSSAAPAMQQVTLPSEFELPLELTSPIDSAKSFVGDLVKLRVADSLRHRGETLIAKDGVATARISRLELVDGNRYLEFTLLGLESGGKRLSLANRTNFIGHKVEQIQFRAKMAAEARATKSAETSFVTGPIVAKAHLELPAGARLLLRSSKPQ